MHIKHIKRIKHIRHMLIQPVIIRILYKSFDALIKTPPVTAGLEIIYSKILKHLHNYTAMHLFILYKYKTFIYGGAKCAGMGVYSQNMISIIITNKTTQSCRQF